MRIELAAEQNIGVFLYEAHFLVLRTALITDLASLAEFATLRPIYRAVLLALASFITCEKRTYSVSLLHV